jgi:hypothetical protein
MCIIIIIIIAVTLLFATLLLRQRTRLSQTTLENFASLVFTESRLSLCLALCWQVSRLLELQHIFPTPSLRSELAP